MPPRRMPLALLTGLLAVIGAAALQAQPYISGEIQFEGGATLDTGSLGTATAFTSIFGPGGPGTMPDVLGGGTQTGDYASVPTGTLVSFQTFSFASSGPVTPLWAFTVGGINYSFDADSVVLAFQNSYFLDIKGTGTAYIDGYSPTSGSWEVTDTGAGDVPVFTFGAATTVAQINMPEPSAVSLILLFAPVAGVVLWMRRKAQGQVS